MTVERATVLLAEAGFDIVHPFDAIACARGLDAPRLGAKPLGLLVGNTRALWPRFVAARAADTRLAHEPHALDRYTEQSLARAVAVLPGADVLFAHHADDDGRFLPFQRLAVLAGLGALSPTQLVIHPVYGPWFALRAVMLCDWTPPPLPAPFAQPCTCDAPCLDAFSRALATPAGPARPAAWRAVRDACSHGREHRYSDDQIAYHYSFLA